MSQDKHTRPYSSFACFMHELDEPPRSWEEIRIWRTARRKERILQRLGYAPDERRRVRRVVIEQLLGLVDVSTYPVLGMFWPIRGEIDVRDVARRHIAAGGQVALPVVVAQAAPIEFWRWRPGMRMQRGLWNIPVPRERDIVVPNALVVPMVGFDRTLYRLGYGGGYYDRTLAAAEPRPHAIGIAYADAELASIYPQCHDVSMDVVVTDQGTFGGMLHRNAERAAGT